MQRFGLAASVLLFSAYASAAIPPTEAARLNLAAQVVRDIHGSIPQEYWDRARCVAVIPELKKAAFIVGGEFGRGVMSCRAGSAWSAPVFMQLAKGSWGFQAGAEQVDVVLLVMNESGVQKLLQNQVNLGADASVAAGPLGRHGSVGTDAALTAEILSYSRAQGLFAGINLSGGVLRPDEGANRDVYGDSATPRTLLASSSLSAPTEATPFLHALGTGAESPSPEAATSASSTAAPTTAAPAAKPSPPPTAAPLTPDADIRARVVELQQTIDRLVADANASAIGTGGASADTTANGATLAVSRERLGELRRQVAALLAQIDKRQ
ncbi:MAG TPA: lipid-binding SYLF domain-containing protein [Vicinamibacterales bacterium]